MTSFARFHNLHLNLYDVIGRHQNALAMATSDPITTILPHHKIARYIRGKVLWYGRIILNCLKLLAIQSWRGHQNPPSPPPPGRIGLSRGPHVYWCFCTIRCNSLFITCLITYLQQQQHLLLYHWNLHIRFLKINKRKLIMGTGFQK